MKPILDRNEPVLREIATEVAISLIQSDQIQSIINDMKTALASQDDGVAIAAPQIGVSKRIFVVSGKVLGYMRGEDDGGNYDDLVFINPNITKYSRKKELMEEGCLSVRYMYGKVERSTKVQIEAFNEHGTPISRGASGLMAQIFQHEIDHLNGILFIDKAKDLEDIPKEVFESRSRKTK